MRFELYLAIQLCIRLEKIGAFQITEPSLISYLFGDTLSVLLYVQQRRGMQELHIMEVLFYHIMVMNGKLLGGLLMKNQELQDNGEFGKT